MRFTEEIDDFEIVVHWRQILGWIVELAHLEEGELEEIKIWRQDGQMILTLLKNVRIRCFDSRSQK